MLHRLLGTKIGMTQIFDKNRNVIPVTVIDVSGWLITQVKTKEQDGYSALQLGLPRKKYRKERFAAEWLKSKAKFFLHVKEVLLDGDDHQFSVAQKISANDFQVQIDERVDVAGKGTGRGFQGVMKRWGFSGGPGGHGSTFHRKPGAIGNMCSQGKVVKGKKLPGQYGGKRISVKGLRLAKIDAKSECLFVKGAVPGRKDSLLFIKASAPVKRV